MYNATITDSNVTDFRTTQTTFTSTFSMNHKDTTTQPTKSSNTSVPPTEGTTLLTTEAANIYAQVLTPLFITTTAILLIAVVVLSIFLYRIKRNKAGSKNELVINSNDYSPTPKRQMAETELQLSAMDTEPDNSELRGRANPSFHMGAEVALRDVRAKTNFPRVPKLSDPTGYTTANGSGVPDKRRLYTKQNVPGTLTRDLPSPTEHFQAIRQDLDSSRVPPEAAAKTSMAFEPEEIYMNVGENPNKLVTRESSEYMPMEGHNTESPQEEVEYVNHGEVASGPAEDTYEVPLSYSAEQE